jgi:hypothetical protein
MLSMHGCCRSTFNIAAPANARVRGTLYLEETMDLSG